MKNKKMKRFSKSSMSIILTLMMIVSTITVGLISVNSAYTSDIAETGDADVYAITGSWDSWATKNYFSGTAGTDAEITLDLSVGTYYFKCYSSYGSGAWYGANTSFSDTGSYYFKTSDSTNATLVVSTAGTYTFSLLREDQGDGAVNIQVTYPTTSSSWYLIGDGYSWTPYGDGSEFTYNDSTGYYEKSVSWTGDTYFRVYDGSTQYSGDSSSSSDYTISSSYTSTSSGTWTGLVENTSKSFYFYAGSSATSYTIVIDAENMNIMIIKDITPFSGGYYIAGAFRVYDGSSTYTYTDGSDGSTFTTDTTEIPFTAGTCTLSDSTYTNYYSLDTNLTVAQLSATLGSSTSPYFVIYDQLTWFGDYYNTSLGSSFVSNNTSESSALTLKSYDSSALDTTNEVIFNDEDDGNGTVVLNLKVVGTEDEINAGTASYYLWYTKNDAKDYVADSLALTASPSSAQVNSTITLTATPTNFVGTDNSAQYTFYKRTSTSDSWTQIGTTSSANYYSYTEESSGTIYYKAVLTSTDTDNSEAKYYERVAYTTASVYTPGMYVSDYIDVDDVSSTTFDDTDLSTDYASSVYTIETSTTYTNSNPYIFALSTKSTGFTDDYTELTIDDSLCQYCTITKDTSSVKTTIDDETVSILSYVVTPNTNCTNPTIYIDSCNTVYAVATYSGATETTTLSASKTVTYYFAEMTDSDSVNLSDCNSSSNQTTAGTGLGMRIRYWNASVYTGGSSSYMGITDVYTQATVDSSNTIYVNLDELNTKTSSGNSGVQAFYVYKVDLPIGATSFSFTNSSGTDLDVEYLWSQDSAAAGSTASDVLNPNRIYLLYNAEDGGVSGKYYRAKGIILDEHLWNTNTSSSATNQVDTKNFDANLINYTDISSLSTDLETQTVNSSLSTLYTNRTTPHTLYFGYFGDYSTSSSLYNYYLYKNVAQRYNSRAYYAALKDLVGPVLSTTYTNKNGYGYLLDTHSNNDYGVSQAAIQPLFDYTQTTSGTYDIVTAGVASAVYEELNFPMNVSEFNGITTYSYDSTTDYNRIYSSSDFKVMTSSDSVDCMEGSGQTGYNNYCYGYDANNAGYAGFFPFGGNSNEYSNTGFGTEFDISFYMTNTGYLLDSDGNAEDICFNFSGDDDVWIYVDGVLALDLGGDHKVSAGSINFTDGKVYYKCAANTVSSVTSTTDAWAYSSSYVKTVDLTDLMESYGKDFDSTDASTKHTLQMFYMERGAFQSNCSLSFNLPQASGLSIMNNVTATNVNSALQAKALYAANPDYFGYTIAAEHASSVPSAYSGYSLNTPVLDTDISGLVISTPTYPYTYDTYRVYSDGTYSDVSYQLSSSSSTGAAGSDELTFSDSEFVNIYNTVFSLSDKWLTGTDPYLYPTGKTTDGGVFYLLPDEMATFDNKIPNNSYVKISQSNSLGTVDTSGATVAYKAVSDNDVSNYFNTSYSVYDEKSKEYIVEKTDDVIYTSSDIYAADSNINSEAEDSFYFTNYLGESDSNNAAMRVDFYNDIAVGSIKISKALSSGSSSSNFKFKVELANVFGDTTDTSFTEYEGLVYKVYTASSGALVKTAYYNTTSGVMIQAGQYAVIEGIPVETRFQITEMETAGFSFNNFSKSTYMADGSTKVSTVYGESTYDTDEISYDDSSSTSAVTTSSAYIYEDSDGSKFYTNTIPVVQDSYSSDDSTYVSISAVTYTNDKEEITVTFKYYDRNTTSTYAAINSTPSSYSSNLDDFTDYITYDSSSNFEKIDFASLIGEKVVEFSNSTCNTKNLIDEYFMWTSQADAVTAMQLKAYLKYDNSGSTNYSADQAVYHTQSDGTPNTSGEKWVTYYDEDGEALDAENFTDGDETSYNSVKSIVVWLFNQPREYTVNVYGAQSSSDLNSIQGSSISNKFYDDYSDSILYVSKGSSLTTENAMKTGVTAYYSQRLGDEKGDDYLDCLAYLETYGLDGCVGSSDARVCPEDYAAESITVSDTDYVFAYWSYDSAGSTVASTEYIYGYRVTGDFDLYAVYAPEAVASTVHGLTITKDTTDTYVNSSGKSKTRLNVMFTPYNCPDYDENILNIGIVNIYVTKLVAAGKTQSQILALMEEYKTQLYTLLAAKTNFSDKPTICEVELTTKGYVYATSGTSSVTLTNKNRIQITNEFYTSNLYPTSSNVDKVSIVQIGAMYYENAWVLSDNMIYRRFIGGNEYDYDYSAD